MPLRLAFPYWCYQDMTFSAEHLLTELDRDPDQNTRFWATELKNGKEAYVFLMKAVRGTDLNANQMRNALHALFRIADHGSRTEVLDTFIELAGHENKEIRSTAVSVAIGLIQFTNQTRPVAIALSEKQKQDLRDAIAAGLTQEVTKRAVDFLGT